MSFRHHPSDETLLRGAAGGLRRGLGAVLAAHLETCPRCRARLNEFEALGGLLIEGSAPASQNPAALEKIFARIDAAEAAPFAPPARRPPPPRLDGLALPRALGGATIGPWRFIHPKLRWAHVKLPGASDGGLLLLKLAPGFAVPPHGHGGLELTQVLEGRFCDHLGEYVTGDLIENDRESPSHEPRAGNDEACLCLTAVERPLLMKSWIARLAQPLMGL